jgi:hypothetical protein
VLVDRILDYAPSNGSTVTQNRSAKAAIADKSVGEKPLNLDPSVGNP